MAGLTCPQCGKRMTLNFSTNVVSCPHCGYVRLDEIAQIEQQAQAVKAKGQRPAVEITYKGEINSSAYAAFETGQDLLFNGKNDEAIQSFKRAIEHQSDFIDAHLWVAKASSDAAVKRDYLGNVLAMTSNHLEATRLLMVLNGRLTPDQAARTVNPSVEPATQQLDEVQAKIQALLCPQCGGHLTVNDAKHRVECAACGFSAPDKTQKPIGEGLLTVALLERRAQPIRWNIGKRTFQCNQCGAEHTLTAEKMTARCRFCGSTQVILNDTVGSFEQPHAIIPFQLTTEQAHAQIERQLGGLREKVNVLLGNRVDEIDPVEGVYLPFWVFDVNVEVIQTRVNHAMAFGGPDDNQWLEMLPDVAVAAVRHLPEPLLAQLNDYNFSEPTPYEPRWLAKIPAQVYTIDVDAASLIARGRIAERMRFRYKPQTERTYFDETGEQRKEILYTRSNVQSMTLQLFLLPVWIATLRERDGDTRLALVNGQTGKTVIGQLQKRNEKDRDTSR